ncbi:MAG: hypothetical protein V3W41_20800 [Planctomycetota bacterium]
MVVVKRYDEAYAHHRVAMSPPISALRSTLMRIGNACLPPNVFYLEIESEGQRHRAKYALLDVDDLDRYTRPDCLQPYFWGRLAQPVAVVWSAGPESKTRLEDLLQQAQSTMLAKIAPRIALPAATTQLWSQGLADSYRTEFRAEKKQGRASELAAFASDHYRDATERHAMSIGGTFSYAPDRDEALNPGEPLATAPAALLMRQYSAWDRRKSAVAWLLRRIQGRILQVMRLSKAAWTFDGGIEYLLWKIERHSGVRVEPGPLTRKHPLLLGWIALWKARRQGGFK